MPRPPRLLLSQSCYHIMTRGNNRNKVFRDHLDYTFYLDKLTSYKAALPFDLFHYCLMPNHVHLLVRTKDAASFSLLMKKLNLSYFHYFKRRYGWVGHFWQGRFKSQPVGKDNYFIQCGKYIELNPIRAGIITKAEDYPYSSYAHYAKDKQNSLLTDDIFYADLGKTPAERQKKYNELVIADVIQESYKNRSWGSVPQRYNENKKIKNHINLKVTNN